jgi:hypothetical protein
MPATRFAYAADEKLARVHFEEGFLMASREVTYRYLDREATSQKVDTTFNEVTRGPVFIDILVQANYKSGPVKESIGGLPPKDEESMKITFCLSLLTKAGITNPSNRDHVIIEGTEYSFLSNEDPQFWDDRKGMALEVALKRFK